MSIVIFQTTFRETFWSTWWICYVVFCPWHYNFPTVCGRLSIIIVLTQRTLRAESATTRDPRWQGEARRRPATLRARHGWNIACDILVQHLERVIGQAELLARLTEHTLNLAVEITCLTFLSLIFIDRDISAIRDCAASIIGAIWRLLLAILGTPLLAIRLLDRVNRTTFIQCRRSRASCHAAHRIYCSTTLISCAFESCAATAPCASKCISRCSRTCFVTTRGRGL